MLTADQLIDAYVADVTRLLPHRQRDDVALELRSLLHDELRGRDATAALDLLRGFGRPAEVAARYGNPVSVIDPIDTRRFLQFAVVGSIFLLYTGFLDALRHPSGRPNPVEQALRERWAYAFAWLGVLLCVFALSAWKRRRWPSTTAWKPRPRSEAVNRFGRSAAIVAWAAGAVVLFTADRIFPAAVFTYTDDYLRLRGPLVLAWIVIALGLQVALVVQGGYRPWIRTAELALNAAMCVLFTWVVTAPIFQAAPTDDFMRSALVVIAAVTLIDVSSRVYHRIV